MNPKQFHRRLIGVVLVLAILMTFLCSNLYSIQYINGADYANQSVARSYENQTVSASRGLLLDRNGQVLVSNEISYQVTLLLSYLGENEEERCANLLALIQVCREEGVTWADTLPITTTAPFTIFPPLMAAMASSSQSNTLAGPSCTIISGATAERFTTAVSGARFPFSTAMPPVSE